MNGYGAEPSKRFEGAIAQVVVEGGRCTRGFPLFLRLLHFSSQHGLDQSNKEFCPAHVFFSMLLNFLQPRIENIIEEEGLEDLWFQQDGAIARNSLSVLREMFPRHLVPLRGDVGKPTDTLEELREQIIEEVNAIPEHC